MSITLLYPISDDTGDRYLKPYVISDPEVTLTRRSKKDKFIILASDGLWDVMTPRYAGQVTHKCLKKCQTKGDDSSRAPLPENNERPSRSAYAAALTSPLWWLISRVLPILMLIIVMP